MASRNIYIELLYTYMNRFKALFFSPEWTQLKADSLQFLRTLSTWLETFPQKETSILLVILALWICMNAARILIMNFLHPRFLFSLETIVVGVAFALFAYLGVNRFQFLRNKFFKKIIT